jgi:hypothetical protein
MAANFQMRVTAGIFLASILLKEMRYLVYIKYLRTGGTPKLRSDTSLFLVEYHVGYTRICYSRTYIFLLAITSKPSKVFKTVNNFSCTCKFHKSNIFSDRTRLLTLLSVFFVFTTYSRRYMLSTGVEDSPILEDFRITRLLTLCP